MRLARAGLVLLVAAVVTSCASPEPSGHARPTGAAASGDATAGPPRITLPLDPYQVSDEDFGTVSRALAELTDRCMRRQGLTYEAPAPQDTAATSPTGHERRYGITVLESARRHGYHLAGAPAQEPKQPKRSKAYQRALTGTGEPLGGPGEFDDGCTGEAHRKLESGIDMEAVDLPQWYKRDSFQRSLDDPRVKAAFGAWSRCMAEAGHRFATPLDPPADPGVMGRTVTEHEQSVAVADITCKQRTGLVGAWQQVESALQRSTVTSRAAQLRKARAEAARLVARADRILAADGG
ncbi:hypothetical protein [Streptomyces sp. NPDC093598]|uniref:hypothetical protein n=1 Tax=Streptomyces sp. NPDC093598 TaxID=3366046 RepID=UPI0037FD742D